MCLEEWEYMAAIEIDDPAARIVSCLALWKREDGIEVFQPSSRLAKDTVHEL